ncbi:MAG: hypothetical protein AAF761_07630 [Pseudomonadota bacterium]
MRARPIPLFVFAASLMILAGCVPPPLIVGAGAVVGADAIMENEEGGDGLF